MSMSAFWIFPCKNIEPLLQKMQRICRGRCYTALRAITCINFSEVPSSEELRVFNRLRPSMSETLGSGMCQCKSARWWAVCWPPSDGIFALDQKVKKVQKKCRNTILDTSWMLSLQSLENQNIGSSTSFHTRLNSKGWKTYVPLQHLIWKSEQIMELMYFLNFHFNLIFHNIKNKQIAMFNLQ